MNWIPIKAVEQLDELIQLSNHQPQVIFKHSTRCIISAMAKKRLEKAAQPSNTNFYILDLLAYRPVSNKIAQLFDVKHESPQILLIKNGKCVYTESHTGIDMADIQEHLFQGV